MKSKLFTPVPKDHGCFVNPFTKPEGMAGFAPTTPAAAYPLKLSVSGGRPKSLMPETGPFVSHNMDEY